MNHDRAGEIASEMSALLEQQSRAMRDERAGSIIRMSAEEREGYSQRNERLQQLAKELTELA